MMMGCWRLTVLSVTVCALLAGQAQAANVLAIFPLPTRSHWFSLKQLLTGLSKRGHNITLLISEMEEDIPESWDVMRIPVILPEFAKCDNMMKIQSSAVGMKIYDVLIDTGIDFCEKLFQQEAVQRLISTKGKRFDLLLIEYYLDECLLGFAYKFGIPVIALSSFGGFPFTTDVVGDLYTPSYVPDVVSPYTDHMTFWQWFHNTLSVTYARYVFNYRYCPKMDEMMKENFKDPTMPSVSALMANTTLMIFQSHESFAYPRSHLPNVIEIGGMHIQQPKALPKDLKKLMDNAEDGVIFFSMGSLVRSSDFPQGSVQDFLTVFSKLKQLVLWKWEMGTMPGKPENVHVDKWFPQTDLLAHKNIKLFISHGGLQSSLEATARGVPLVGIPVGAEQAYNVQRIVSHGYGIKLDLQNITVQSVEWAVHEVLNNPTYREKAQLRSRLIGDRPQSATETAVYWAEYVLRHGGLPQLHSAAIGLSWYQFFLLNFAPFLLAAVLLLLTAAVVAVSKLCRLLKAKVSPPYEQMKKRTIKKSEEEV